MPIHVGCIHALVGPTYPEWYVNVRPDHESICPVGLMRTDPSQHDYI